MHKHKDPLTSTAEQKITDGEKLSETSEMLIGIFWGVYAEFTSLAITRLLWASQQKQQQ